jgi:hypothetical protein
LQYLTSIFKTWLIITVVLTSLCGIVYVTAQQMTRWSANDPQIQIAQDLAAVLKDGGAPEAMLPDESIDIATSLSPYVVIFDDTGKAIAGTGVLHGDLPTMPAGVFENARRSGENRVTWQPEPGVRSATVVTHYSGDEPGFVMAGRSLREVESRINRLGQLIGLGWLFSAFATLAAIAVIELIFSTGAIVRGFAKRPKSAEASARVRGGWGRGGIT